MAGMLEIERSRTRRERTFIGSECAVCEEPLEHTLRGERILQFSCGHVSHEACFYEYIKEFESQYCPTCNAPLGLDTSRGGNVLDLGKVGRRLRNVANIDAALQKNSATLFAPCLKTTRHGIINVMAVVLAIPRYRGIHRPDRRDRAVEDRTSVVTVHKDRTLGKSKGTLRGTPGKSSVTEFKDMEVKAINLFHAVIHTIETRAGILAASIRLENMVVSLKVTHTITPAEGTTTMCNPWKRL